MFIKVIGSCVVVISLTLISVMSANKLLNRIKYLKIMCNSLEFIKSEMLYKNTTILNIICKLGHNVYFQEIGIFGKLYQYLLSGQSINQSWCKTIKVSKLPFVLNKNEFEDIIHIGDWLGCSCVDDQVSSINLVLSDINRKIELARIDKDKYYKIYNTFGLLSGLAVVILLW